MAIWKLILAVALTLGLMISLPFVLSAHGLIGPIHPRATIILVITASGLAMKMLLGDIASGKFDYYKHGYDLCIITLGSALSGFALQMTSREDLFPGVTHIPHVAQLETLFPQSTTGARVIELGSLFIFVCIFTIFTARIAMAVREETTRFSACLSLINFLCGAGVFSFYVLLLITKG